MLAVFQILTLDSWSVILYLLMGNHVLPQIPACFCIVLVFLGSFFLLNLMLAVVMEAYMDSERREGQRIDNELR